jgi:uncharacterized membrane protein HdeD (DUF308 family)
MNPNEPTSAARTGQTSLSSSDAIGGDAAHDAAMCALLAQNWWAVALRGVFAVLFGLIALFVPGATILSLVLFFSAYMLVDGAFGIVAAVRAARAGERWMLLVLEGLLNIAVGLIAFVWPGLTVIAFVLLLAAWSLVSGGLMLGAAFRLSKEHGRWWLALGGVVSIIFGVLLAIAPLIGAVVLTWWLGAYALIFGIALLVLAFKLRAHKDDTPHTAVPRAA